MEAVVRTTRIVGDTIAAKLDMSHILDLVEAAEGGDVAAVAELLQAGLSVNAQVTGRFTLLALLVYQSACKSTNTDAEGIACGCGCGCGCGCADGLGGMRAAQGEQ